MLVDGTSKSNQRYNVVVNGKVKRENVLQRVAEQYIQLLSEDLQAKATMVPVTDDGKQILFG